MVKQVETKAVIGNFSPKELRTSVDPMLKDEKSSCRIASPLLALLPALLLESPCLSYWYGIHPCPPKKKSSAIDLFKIANLYPHFLVI